MAANVLTTVMFALLVAVWSFLCITGTLSHVPYAISKTSDFVKSSDSSLVLKFESHSHNRLRRQNSGGGVVADATTNTGAGGQPLLDESSQPASADSSKNTSSPSPAFSTTFSPKETATTPIGTSRQSSGEWLTTSVGNPFEDADVVHDFHKYYTSDVISNKFSEHWVELEDAPKHETLSTGHRVAAVINLMFDFYFYGHRVTNVTIATGGFLYMSPFLHQWLTATQNIACLMANFDPSFSSESSIFVQNEKDRFIVEWKNVVLKDQNTTGRFHFQVILKEDNSIKFVYKSIPFPVANISNEEHPVKVGLSDAYYNDTFIPELNIKRRTIYEYHKVSLPLSLVASGTVIVLTPMPTCNRLVSCNSCVVHIGVNFDCRWCSTLGRCSDGLDWYRQHWDREGCQTLSVENCEVPTTENPFISDSSTPDNHTVTEMTATGSFVTPATSVNPFTTVSNTHLASDITPTTTTTTTTTTTITSTVPSGAGDTSHTSRRPSTTSNAVSGKFHMDECGHTKDAQKCLPDPSPIKHTTDPSYPRANKDPCFDGKCNKKSQLSVAVVVIVVLIICGLIAGVVGWVYYAYTHPTSRSGMWLMEHRPSQIKSKIKFWKSSSDAGTKYKVESEA